MSISSTDNTLHPGKLWLENNWPKTRAVDVDYTMKRYDYPDIVQKYIIDNWIKISDENGGTYCEQEYYKNLKLHPIHYTM